MLLMDDALPSFISYKDKDNFCACVRAESNDTFCEFHFANSRRHLMFFSKQWRIAIASLSQSYPGKLLRLFQTL